MTGPSVAILGAGIMGVTTAIFLARAGCRVTLIESREHPLMAASRWNEGKIHLGFLYAADASLRTMRHLLPGGLAFRPLMERLIGTALDPAMTAEDDIYVVHPDSVVGAEAMGRYFSAVAEVVAAHPHRADYLKPLAPVRPLTRAALEALSPRSRAGFRVPERSVNTIWVADRLQSALAAEPAIRILTGMRVLGVAAGNGSFEGPFTIRAEPVFDEPFDWVVNALWEGRIAVDASLGLAPEPGWSHRYRLSLFVRTGEPLALPSLVIATGPFGDVKNYDGEHFYLSWYPAGLVAEGHGLESPEIRDLPSADSLIAAVRQGLCGFVPGVERIFEGAASIEVGGGWVFANGRGSLADPKASLHRRDDFGIRRAGRYFSVDTGKYSTAPWLAQRVAQAILSEPGS